MIDIRSKVPLAPPPRPLTYLHDEEEEADPHPDPVDVEGLPEGREGERLLLGLVRGEEAGLAPVGALDELPVDTFTLPVLEQAGLLHPVEVQADQLEQLTPGGKDHAGWPDDEGLFRVPEIVQMSVHPSRPLRERIVL